MFGLYLITEWQIIKDTTLIIIIIVIIVIIVLLFWPAAIIACVCPILCTKQLIECYAWLHPPYLRYKADFVYNILSLSKLFEHLIVVITIRWPSAAP